MIMQQDAGRLVGRLTMHLRPGQVLTAKVTWDLVDSLFHEWEQLPTTQKGGSIG